MIAAEVGFTGDSLGYHQTKGQPRRCLEVSQARKLFGFQAAHRLCTGIPKTVAWFQAHYHNLREVSFF